MGGCPPTTRQEIRTAASSGAGGPVRAVVDAVAVAQQVQAHARADIDQAVGTIELRCHPRETGADDGAPATFVRLNVTDGEEGQNVISARPHEVEEERSGVGRRTTGVDVSQRMLGPLKNQIVHCGEERWRQMGRGGRPLDELEDFVIPGDRLRDALVER